MSVKVFLALACLSCFVTFAAGQHHQMPATKTPAPSPSPTVLPTPAASPHMHMNMPTPAASPSPGPKSQMPEMNMNSPQTNISPLVMSEKGMGVRVGSVKAGNVMNLGQTLAKSQV